MKKIYFEASSINRVTNQGEIGLTALLQSLRAHGQEPVVGLHVVYELARTFLDPEAVERGKRLFQCLRELNPSYPPEAKDLLLQEILKLRHGSAVVPVLPYLESVSTKSEVARLAPSSTVIGIFSGAP
jgi:hypothetical protein